MPEPTDHALLQPRSQVAIGLVGVWGVGVGLMAARVDILLGSLIAILPPLGVVWLYWKHLKSAARALHSPIIVEGVTPTEMLLATMTVGGMIFVDAVMTIQSFYYEEPQLPYSRITIEGVWPEIKPKTNPTKYEWRSSISNSSAVSVKSNAGMTVLKAFDHLPTDQEANTVFDELKAKFSNGNLAYSRNEIYPNKGLSGDVTGVLMSESEFKDFYEGRTHFVFGAIIQYEDENVPKGQHRYTTFCAKDLINQSQQILCNKNNRNYTAKTIDGS